MNDSELAEFFKCPKDISDKIISYYGLDNPGTYIYRGERQYDRTNRIHHYVISWPSLVREILRYDTELSQLYETLDKHDKLLYFDDEAVALVKRRLKSGFYDTVDTIDATQ